MPRFSVIIPLYNKAAYIDKAIDSVLYQSFDDYELIVVDDGSTDGGELLVKKQTDCRIRLITQANAGVSTARNNGVAQASGDYICFLDADDWWAPNFLEEMDGLIALYPNAGIYGCSYFLVKQGHNKIAPIGIDEMFTHGLISYCQVYAKTLCMPLWTGTVSIPRHIFKEQSGFKPHLKLGEDFDLWVRIALQYPVAFLNKPLAYYNQDADMANRAIGKLHPPHSHMLWNLDYLIEHEKSNKDYKILIDKLRVSTLLRYYVTKQYYFEAKQELTKVDWAQQPQHIIRTYRMPLPLLRCYYYTKLYGAQIKKSILKSISKL